MGNIKLQVEGKVHHVGDTEVLTEKFQKRDLIIVIEDNPAYPEYVLFQAVQDRCDILETLNHNELVVVHFNLKGKMYEKRDGKGSSSFTSLQLWKIDRPDYVKPESTMAAKPNTDRPVGTPADFRPGEDDLPPGEEDDLPF